MGCEIHFYGERGLVNAIFLDLQSSARVAEFLRTVEFPFRDPPHLDIPDATDTVVIVEPGFGGNRAGFGWPDAVIVARLPDGQRLAFFLEAKAGLYLDEAEDFTEREPGFHSSINGQFTLRYRLVETLRSQIEVSSRLIEPLDLARAYGEERRPRRLVKEENLQHIVRAHLLGASGYFFIALTDDAANVWAFVHAKRWKLLPFLAEPLPDDSPVVDQRWSEERNVWEQQKQRFGWIGYRGLEPLVEHGRYFRHARHFLDAKRRSRERRAPDGRFANIRTISWDRFAPESPTIRLRDRLRALIEEAIQNTDLDLQRGNGSDSLIGPGQQRLLKLITPVRPHEDAAILFGVSVSTAGFPEAIRARSRGVVGVRNQGFEILGISEGDFGEDGLGELIRDTLANITDRDEGG